MNWCIVAAIQIPLALFWSLFYSLVRAHVEKLALEKSLALHLPGHRVKQILKNPSLLAPGAAIQEVSILFSDIAYFSRIMERASQERLVPLLNKYFQAIITSIHQNNGTVIKLIGDAIFAVWNAPEPQANHADLACQAAISLGKRIGEFNLENQVEVSFLTRLGLHTDQVYVGNFGSAERVDYTAIGKGVNLAARLEGANKILGTEALVSDDFLCRLKTGCVTRKIGQLIFKGCDKVVVVHELLGGMEVEESTHAWRKAFSDALCGFENKQFEMAAAGFQRAITLRREADKKGSLLEAADIPEDGPSRFYLERIGLFHRHPPPADWLGEIKLDEK